MTASSGVKEGSSSASYCQGKDVLLNPDGSTYHVGIKQGDVYPRILTVGSKKRAALIAEHLDKDFPVKVISSSREYHTFTGKYKGVGVSIIAIGMGAPLMDFMVREVSFVTPGPLAIIRFGTCGLFNESLKCGTVVTAGKGCTYTHFNYSHFTGCVNDPAYGGSKSPAYLVSEPVPCHAPLNALLIEAIQARGLMTFDGLKNSGETFYACQGRKTPGFEDENDGVIELLQKRGVDACEMETHQLFFVASRRTEPCYVAGAAIGIVSRTTAAGNVTADDLHRIESEGGAAVLDALIKFNF